VKKLAEDAQTVFTESSWQLHRPDGLAKVRKG
jgi:hypothetical protein